MKVLVVVLVSVVFIAVPAAGQASVPEVLKVLPLDDADSLATTIVTDSEVTADGNGAIKITTHWPTTLNVAEVSDLDVEEARLIYTAKVRTENLEGTAYLEMWCHVDEGTYFSRGMNAPISGTADWETLSTPFVLKRGQKPERVTLNLVVDGKGTVWMDDIRLLKEPLK